MIWAAERIPPRREYLLFDPHPAIKIPKTQMDVIDATYKIPTFRSRTIRVLLKGTVKNAITTGTVTKKGASDHTSLSAPDGTIFSFNKSFSESAMDCKLPCQPQIMGPMRFWIWAEIFRSSQIKNMAESEINPTTDIPPINKFIIGRSLP